MMKPRNRWILLTLFTALAILAISVGFLGLNMDGTTGRMLIFGFLFLCLGLFIWGVYFGRRPPPVPPTPRVPP